jgi:hypothetical protein
MSLGRPAMAAICANQSFSFRHIVRFGSRTDHCRANNDHLKGAESRPCAPTRKRPLSAGSLKNPSPGGCGERQRRRSAKQRWAGRRPASARRCARLRGRTRSCRWVSNRERRSSLSNLGPIGVVPLEMRVIEKLSVACNSVVSSISGRIPDDASSSGDQGRAEVGSHSGRYLPFVFRLAHSSAGPGR